MKKNKTVKVIGAGLAGCEACYQLLKRGVQVELYEMRPNKITPAHHGGDFAELVCSNSLKSTDPITPQGELKRELELLDSMVLRAAKYASVPSGGALAVDRLKFSKKVEEELLRFPNLTIIREEKTIVDDYTIVCAGPLCSDSLSENIKSLVGEKLSFFDAVAPIVTKESIDMDSAYFMSRYNKGDSDYLNCPMNKDEYYAFVEALISGERVILKDFEKRDIFSACQPVEYMAVKGRDTLRFGPLRPVGLYPLGGKKPYAVVQLRPENKENTLFNIVGFQTNLKFAEQKRIFSLIPALKSAEFVRYGVMHRNTFINSPEILNADLSLKSNSNVFFGGQINGGEGYVESVATGLICGINMYKNLTDIPTVILPKSTVLGGLISYITSGNGATFQPMHASFQLTDELGITTRDKAKKKELYAERAISSLNNFLLNNLI